VEQRSAADLFKSLQAEINARLRAIAIDSYGREGRALMPALKQQLVTIRAAMRDNNAAETAAERQLAAATIKTHLEELEKQLLTASTYGMFGPADIAMTTALARQLMAEY
jgi:hypothetical protein